jgi:alpha-beta hydrolase superfamily lysophospholipase
MNQSTNLPIYRGEKWSTAKGPFSGFGGLPLYYQSWRPEGDPRAVLIIVHGFGEHSGRYMNVVNHLVPRGYAIYALDHRGHGRSPGPRGHINSWEEFREDVRAFVRKVAETEPGLPCS